MGSRPSAPVTYRPTPTAPTIYQSVIPEKDFKLAQDYVSDLKAERATKRKSNSVITRHYLPGTKFGTKPLGRVGLLERGRSSGSP